MTEFECTHCRRTKTDAIKLGCGEPAPRYVDVPYEDGVRQERVNACPMIIKNPVKRKLFDWFGWRWVL